MDVMRIEVVEEGNANDNLERLVLFGFALKDVGLKVDFIVF